VILLALPGLALGSEARVGSASGTGSFLHASVLT